MLGMRFGVGVDSHRLPPGAGAPPSTVVNKLIIEGDSMFFAGGEGNGGGAYQFRDMSHPGKTVVLNVQGSRVVGGVNTYGGEGANNIPVGTDNSMLLQRPTDIATAAQAMIFMIGTNDLIGSSTGHYEQDLVEYAPTIRSAGVKLYWSYPVPMRTDGTYGDPQYTSFKTKIAARRAQWRNPAVWGQWADGYWPLGEQPEFNLADNTLYISADGVHPTQLGQDTFFIYMKAIGLSLFDATRQSSTQMYDASWLASETNLTPGDTITRRFIVSGLDPAGTALGASVSGASATMKLNGGSAVTSFGTGSGNGYRLYNGDTVDLTVPLSALNNTAVSIDLTIGSETRTLTFRTVAAVTPVSVSHADVFWNATAGTTESFGVTFVAGVCVVRIVGSIPTAVVAKGVALTKLDQLASNSGCSQWIGVVTAGAGTVDITCPYTGSTACSVDIVVGADPTPLSHNIRNTGYDSAPQLTDLFNVPAAGLALVGVEEYGGASITAATANSGTTFVDEGNGAYQGETHGLAVGTVAAGNNVRGSFTFAFGTFGVFHIVFKALGT